MDLIASLRYLTALLSAPLCHSQNFLLTRALLNLLRKGLGRSKPATLPWNKHKQHVCGDCTLSKLPEPSSIEQNKHYKRERVGYLLLTESSLHRIASDLDVKDHTAMDEFLDDVKSYITNRNLLLYKK